MKTSLKSSLPLLALIIGTSVASLTVPGCERKPKTLGEKIDDALDARPNEKIKDAGEDAADAVKDAAHDVKDAVKDATR